MPSHIEDLRAEERRLREALQDLAAKVAEGTATVADAAAIVRLTGKLQATRVAREQALLLLQDEAFDLDIY